MTEVPRAKAVESPSAGAKRSGTPLWRELSKLRAPVPMWLAGLLSALAIFAVIALWQYYTGGDDPRISPSALPSPHKTLEAYDDLKTPSAQVGGDPVGPLDHAYVSFARLFKGFGLAVIVGVVLGVFAASFRAVQAVFTPIVLAGRSLPLAALIPVTMLIFGIGETQKFGFIFIATVPFIMSDTIAAVLSINQRYVDTALTLGASRWQIIRKVLFPLALPDIVTSVRFMFGLGFGYIMLAELVGAERGLGYAINVNLRRSHADRVFFYLFLILALAIAIELLFRTLQRGLFPYRHDL